MTSELSRRHFLAAALGSGAATTIAPALQPWLWAAAQADAASSGRGYFFDPREQATCAAICARIVPSGADPSTDPGATEAHAVVFIDRFLAAFELPPTVADNPAIYIHGRFSGRNAYPNYRTGTPASTAPPDDFLTLSRRGSTTHFLPLSRLQKLSWRFQLYGPQALEGAKVSPRWKAQLRTLNPAPRPLRPLYRAGLAAFDAYAEGVFHAHFADLNDTQRDVLLAAAGNVILAGLPLPLPSPPAAPDAAKALFPTLTVHTFQACYGLPEYRGLAAEPGLWRELGWDGDTVPLGSSIYDQSLYGPGEGPNRGFGDPAVYQPRGAYRELRPVSKLDETGASRELTDADVAPIVEALRSGRVLGRGEARR